MNDLAGFEEWLRRRNLSEGTVQLYRSHLKAAWRAPRPEARLLSGNLAPKTLAAVRAALLSWATFVEDAVLTKRIKEIRLPKPVRLRPKLPLEKKDWLKLIDRIQASPALDNPCKACLGLIAVRGLRVSDVLRLRRDEILEALRTGQLSAVLKGNRRVEYSVTGNFEPLLRSLAAHKGWERVDELVSPRAQKDRRKAAVARLERLLRIVAKETGLDPVDVHPHRLRRTYAVEYLRMMKGDPEALMNLKIHMRWESIETAAQYVDHPREDKLVEIEERMFKKE